MTSGEWHEIGYAEGWRPNEGDVIIGKVTEVSTGWSDYGSSYYPILTIEPEDGSAPVAVHAFHAALKSQILQQRPQKGQTVGVKFLGKQPSKRNPTQQVTRYIFKIKGGSTVDPYATILAQGAQPAGVPVPVPAQQAMSVGPAPEDLSPDPGDDDIPF